MAWKRIRFHPVTGKPRELCAGVDGQRASGFEKNLASSLREISRRILREAADGLPAYRFAPLLRIEKTKAAGGIRFIHIPRIRDQIVLRALHEDLLRAAMAKGLDLGVPRPAEAVWDFRAALCLAGDAWVLRSDIRSFYDAIPRREVVEEAVALGLSKTAEGLLRRLDLDVRARPPWRSGKSFDFSLGGLPQGLSVAASLSELWAARLDEAAKAHGLAWFRFVDDIAVVCKSPREAEDALDWLLPTLRKHRLEASISKTAIHPLRAGVPWLGFFHFPSHIQADTSRAGRWLNRFASIRRKAAAALESAADPAAKQKILSDFHSEIRDEITGKTSSRPSWYALAQDQGEWKSLDSSLHALIRSLHRRAGAAPPTGRQLPSIHRAIAARREFSARSTADQGPCATISNSENSCQPRA